jgi:hypothetical protein
LAMRCANLWRDLANEKTIRVSRGRWGDNDES